MFHYLGSQLVNFKNWFNSNQKVIGKKAHYLWTKTCNQ